MMLNQINKKIISGLLSVVMTVANSVSMLPELPGSESELTYQSIELYPNGEEAEQVVTLDGMMPEGAKAKAVDVSSDYEGVAAYDITIRDGRKEYQPGEQNPIYVEISDPVITGLITLWHIEDNGNREQIFGFTAEDGKVSFYATGFSVYEIVKELDFDVTCTVVPVTGSTSGFDTYTVQPAGPAETFTYPVVEVQDAGLIRKVSSIEELNTFDLSNTGFFLSGAPGEANNGRGRFATNSITAENRSGIVLSAEVKDQRNYSVDNANVNTHQVMIDAVTNKAAKPFYFEPTGTDGQYYIYCSEDGGITRNYVKSKYTGRTNGKDLYNALEFAENQADATAYTIESGSAAGSIKIRTANQISGSYWYWNYRSDGQGARFSGTDGSQYASAANNNIYIWYSAPSFEIDEDPYQLDGKTYGLVGYQNDTTGNALLAGNYLNTGTQLGNQRITRNADAETGAVSYTSEYGIPGWQFEWVQGTDTYIISAIADDGAIRKYLKLDSAGLSLVENEPDASPLTVIPNSNGRIRLSIPSENNAVNRSNDAYFQRNTDYVDAAARYFDLVDISGVPTDTLKLNGKTFALVNRQDDTKGNAMIAQADSANASQLDNQVVKVSGTDYQYAGDLSGWTFQKIDSNRYTITDGTQYLKLVKDSLTLSEDPFILTVSANQEGKIEIRNTTDKVQVTRNVNTSFNSNNNSNARWLDLAELTTPPAEDPLGLDGMTYGIINSKDSNTGYAMMMEAYNATRLNGKTVSHVSGEQKYTAPGAPTGWTFHWDGYANYKISVDAGGVTQWLKYDSVGLSLVDESEATPVTVTVGEGANEGKISISPLLDNTISAIYRNNDNCFQRGTPTYAALGTSGEYWHDLVTFALNDPYKLDGKQFSLMHYAGGATGEALIAEDTNNALNMSTCVVRPDGGSTSKVLYVAMDTDITEWTFQTAGEDKYYIYADFGGVKKYIHIENGSVSVSDTPQEIQVIPDEEGRIMLSAGGYSVKYQANTDDPDSAGRFTAASGSGDYLYFVAPTELNDMDYVTYKAKEVSVSDVKNGEQIIVYTRVWNGSGYDFFAIDHEGNLVPCFERGDHIMWLSNKINTMVWEFSEYYYEYTDTPNNYYDLYNPYSGKYLAPKRASGSTEASVLSDTPVGINLEGRRYGEYYTTILAWDQPSYAYSGLKADITGAMDGIDDTIIPSTRAKADTFYFARVVDFANDLTEVETVDNTQHGITMKMVDFCGNTTRPAGSGTTTTVLQHEVILNSDYSDANADKQTSNLLSTNLTDGYPTAILSGRSLEELFNASDSNDVRSQYVNHLFIQSILDQSGYFEFDSCQNYATLKSAPQSVDENGRKLYLVMKDGKQVVEAYDDDDPSIPTDAQPLYDFFVSKEIGTHDASAKASLQHGQFFPYDDIDMDTYAVKNGLNLYDVKKKLLPESDPRKYERLHLIEDPNYYFGMQLDASFTQTPDGKDNWGHDIIFEFTGDDDFWLYVDGELVIDLGGIHSALGGSANFATGVVTVNGVTKNLRDIFYENYKGRGMTEAQALEELGKHFAPLTENPASKDDFENVFLDYSTHDMKIFYMERGAGASNLHMRFNLNYVTPGDVILSKELTGSDDLDFELVEYPFQIWYCDDKSSDGTYNPSAVKLLTQDDNNISVKYQNSTRKVQYAESYTPPGCTPPEGSYDSVFFINPQQAVEIHFPKDTLFYMVKECGINPDVYEKVYANGVELEGESDGVTSSSLPPRQSFESSWVEVGERANITITNQVNPDSLRPLFFRKKLYDADYTSTMSDEEANAHKITAEQDPTRFAFRLYLSNGVTDEMTLANMAKYRVISSSGKYCIWDSGTQKFIESSYTNEDALDEQSLKYALAQIAGSDMSAADKAAAKEALLDPITFETSINGQISEIPAWYTVEVPNLPVGVTFMLEERDNETERPLGYDRVQYERVEGTYLTVAGSLENVGVVRANETPKMNVINQRGYEVQAKKTWSDVDFALGHDDIYLALFIKSVDPETDAVTYQLAPDAVHPVRRLSAPETEIRFFMTTLANGKALSDYEILEVDLSGSNITVDADGYVTGYDRNTIADSRIDNNGFASIHATDRARVDNMTGVVFGNGDSVTVYDAEHAADWSNQIQFESGVQLYGDDTEVTAVSIPEKLHGAEYLRTANASGTLARDLCSFTAGAAAEIYVGLDGRINPVPAWLSTDGWQLTDDTITASDGTVLKLYRKNVRKDEAVILGTNGGSGTTRNYVVAAAPIYSYQTEYQQGTVTNSVVIGDQTYTARADRITNTRQGGIVISLYKMGTRDEENHNYGEPLQGGVFTLKKGDERIGSYTSDANGKITILYSFQPDEEYTLVQESAPNAYIGLPEPVTFSVGSGDHPEITVSGNPEQWNDYHLPYVEGDQLVAYIDVYNKPFVLKAVKVDKLTETPLENVHFALYRGVNSVDGLIPDTTPISGCGDLTTNEDGVILSITSQLSDGTYFLRETQPADGYKLYTRPVRFTIRENDVVLYDASNGGASITEETTEGGVTVTTVTSNTGVKLIKKVGGDTYECVLQIPNERSQQDFYFDIEKIIFADRNVHDSDTEQKFVFRVDRFAEDAASFADENIQATFYVALNCDRELDFIGDDNIQYAADDSAYNYKFYHDATGTNAPKYEFLAPDVKVRRTYSTDVYTFPAAIWSGRKTVHVFSEGIYRISEADGWSTTDYDFWKASNRYKGNGDGAKGEAVIDGGFRDSKTTGSNALRIEDEDCVYINVSAVNADHFKTESAEIGGKTVYRPTASFTNTETEFAYLSSQAYADNKIKRANP